MDYRQAYNDWLENPYFDEATKEELRSIANDDNEIRERFYTDLEFGTAGLRGVIGAGTNRMNIYTVRKTTQGLANYICAVNGQERGVAIAFDSRRMSPEFADEAALCLAANGMRLLAAPRPGTDEPFVSGESGAIGTGVLYALMTQPAYRELAESLRLNADAQVLLISTEGDTSPDVYEDIVWFGRNG